LHFIRTQAPRSTRRNDGRKLIGRAMRQNALTCSEASRLGAHRGQSARAAPETAEAPRPASSPSREARGDSVAGRGAGPGLRRSGQRPCRGLEAQRGFRAAELWLNIWIVVAERRGCTLTLLLSRGGTDLAGAVFPAKARAAPPGRDCGADLPFMIQRSEGSGECGWGGVRRSEDLKVFLAPC